MTYYYKPWELYRVEEELVVRTSAYNDYVDIWYLEFEHIEWWSERGPNNGIAGFKIWGKDWEIQEMLDLYSPLKDNKIELIMSRDYPRDAYTVTLLNIGEKNSEALANNLVHAYFKIE